MLFVSLDSSLHLRYIYFIYLIYEYILYGLHHLTLSNIILNIKIEINFIII